MWTSQGTSAFSVKGAHGNVTEELFVLNLLLCSLVPRSMQVSIQHLHPTEGVSPRGPPPPRPK